MRVRRDENESLGKIYYNAHVRRLDKREESVINMFGQAKKSEKNRAHIFSRCFREASQLRARQKVLIIILISEYAAKDRSTRNLFVRSSLMTN